MKNNKKLFKYNRGLTLIELLVVISILGLLSSIITTPFNDIREKTRIAKIRQFSNSIYHSLPDIRASWNFDDGTFDNSINTEWNKTPGNIYYCTLEDGGVSGKTAFCEWGEIRHERLPGSQSIKNTSGAITVEGWAKNTSSDGGITYIATGCPNCMTYPWTLQLHQNIDEGNSEVRWQISNGYGQQCYFLSDVTNIPNFDPKGWNHFAGTYDGVSKSRLFVNGYEVTTGFNGSCSGPYYSGWPDPDIASFRSVAIGAGDHYGYVDEVKIYYESLP